MKVDIVDFMNNIGIFEDIKLISESLIKFYFDRLLK